MGRHVHGVTCAAGEEQRQRHQCEGTAEAGKDAVARWDTWLRSNAMSTRRRPPRHQMARAHPGRQRTYDDNVVAAQPLTNDRGPPQPDARPTASQTGHDTIMRRNDQAAASRAVTALTEPKRPNVELARILKRANNANPARLRFNQLHNPKVRISSYSAKQPSRPKSD
jgi:hypothetical protein